MSSRVRMRGGMKRIFSIINPTRTIECHSDSGCEKNEESKGTDKTECESQPPDMMEGSYGSEDESEDSLTPSEDSDYDSPNFFSKIVGIASMSDVEKDEWNSYFQTFLVWTVNEMRREFNENLKSRTKTGLRSEENEDDASDGLPPAQSRKQTYKDFEEAYLAIPDSTAH